MITTYFYCLFIFNILTHTMESNTCTFKTLPECNQSAIAIAMSMGPDKAVGCEPRKFDI